MSAIYVKIEGIEGESKDSKHKGWIDALAASYGVEQSSSISSGGGGGVGKASFDAVTFTHALDRASPTLFAYCAEGKHIKKVDISLCKSGGGLEEYAHITLSDVLVVDVEPAGAAGTQWVETIRLSYSTIKIEVKEQSATGSMGATVTGTWDVKLNKAC